MMQPTLDALHALGRQGTTRLINAFVIQALELPPEIAQQPHKPGSSLTEVEYRLQWTRTYLRQFGLIDSPRRGYWALTDVGRETLQLDSHEISRTVRANAVTRRGLAEAEVEGSDDLDGESPESSPDTAVVPAIGHVAVSTASGLRSPTPLFPTYGNARHFLRIFDGVAGELPAMASAIWDQRGNPQEQVELDAIRTSGSTNGWTARTASWRSASGRIRSGSSTRATRAAAGILSCKHGLLARGRDDILHVSERGHVSWTAGGKLEAEIDEYEGCWSSCSWWPNRACPPQRPAAGLRRIQPQPDHLPERELLKMSLYDRLRNLIDRDLVVARGNSYEVTEAGLAYLERYAAPAPGQAKPAGKRADLFRLARP